jgi:type VI secretion system protein VasD
MGMGMKRRSAPAVRGVGILLGCLVLLAGCSSAPPKPVATKATLVVAQDVNPDSNGRPSPIVVRIYQLKEEGAFNNADYFALMDKEQEALGASLLSREEYELQPGESRTLDLKIPPEARYLGAIAGYRDIRNAHWKALSPAPEKSLKDLVVTKKLTISFGKAEVKVAAK